MHIFKVVSNCDKNNLKKIYIDTGVLLEKYTSQKLHTKLHPGLEWCIFHEDIGDVISSLVKNSE